VVPDIARRLPRDEAALTGLLLDRLSPYLDYSVSQDTIASVAAL
jgi:hypothetical protein